MKYVLPHTLQSLTVTQKKLANHHLLLCLSILLVLPLFFFSLISKEINEENDDNNDEEEDVAHVTSASVILFHCERFISFGSFVSIIVPWQIMMI